VEHFKLDEWPQPAATHEQKLRFVAAILLYLETGPNIGGSVRLIIVAFGCNGLLHRHDQHQHTGDETQFRAGGNTTSHYHRDRSPHRAPSRPPRR
jgi:hypothetical protein